MKEIAMTRAIVLCLFMGLLPLAAQALPIEHEVRIATPDPGVTLAGTLLLPAEGASTRTVVLLVTGSGDHPRDAVISGTPLFRVIAEDLAGEGIASLRLDDRGTADSTGPKTTESTTADRVVDMAAALAWLREHTRETIDHFGVLGHSEGASIALRLAAGPTPPDFLVLAGAPARPGAEVWVEQQLAGFRQGVGIEEPATLEEVRAALQEAARLSMQGADADAMRENTVHLFALGNIDVTIEEGRPALEGFVGRMTDRWMRHFLADDPSEVLDRVRVPVLAIYGSHDRLTSPAQNAVPLLDGLQRAGNADITLRILPDQDHFFLRHASEPVGVHKYGEMTVAPSLLDAQRNWILEYANTR